MKPGLRRGVCGDDDRRNARSETIKFETRASMLAFRNDDIVWINSHIAFCSRRRRHVVITTTMFVEQDDEQCALPVRAIANRIIDRRDQGLSPMKVCRSEEL